VSVDRAGNNRNKAKSIGSISGSKTLGDRIGGADKHDFYRFTLNNSSSFKSSLNGLKANADLHLLNQAGQVLQKSTRKGKSSESIAATLGAGTYFIRVQSRDRKATKYKLSLSSVPISSIPTSSITVINPNGGNSLTKGNGYSLSWNDNIDENVRIDLFKGGIYSSNITPSTPSNGSYYWTVPTPIANGSDYQIRISSTSNPSLGDYSDTTFSIAPVPTPALALVRDIYPGIVGSDPDGFTVFNNALYFQADDGTSGNELWRVDGSGTAALVRDIFPGIGSSNPEGFTVFNNALYFQANDFSNGTELWRVDSSGTAALVSNINPAPGGGPFAGGSSAPHGFTVFNNALYFTANDGTNGFELWKLDNSGTAALVGVINPSIFGGPNSLTVFNNALYFQVDDGTTGIELWKLDSSGTVAQVSDINPGFLSSDPFNFTVFNNALYFAASDRTNGRELWRVDSLGGVARVSDINPGSDSSYPNRFSVFNNDLYFYASDGTTGFELWKVDSSGAVALVKDINPGSGSSNPFAFTDPNNALVFNNALYFSAKDGTNGTELWKVDSSGTAALVRVVNPGSDRSDLGHFTVFNNSLYFSTGLELWKVDSSGTAARVSNINSRGRVEEDFTEFNNALYFQASRGGGRELWRFSDI